MLIRTKSESQSKYYAEVEVEYCTKTRHIEKYSFNTIEELENYYDKIRKMDWIEFKEYFKYVFSDECCVYLEEIRLWEQDGSNRYRLEKVK